MANWYNGWRWNATGLHNGFFWNGAIFKYLVNLRETIRLSEEVTESLANIAIKDEKLNLIDDIATYSMFEDSDEFYVKDKSEFSALFDFSENFGFKEELTDLLVYSAISDKLDVIERIKSLNAYLQDNDYFHLIDELGVEALFNLSEKFKMADELTEMLVMAKVTDNLKLLDNAKVISAFISTNEKFRTIDNVSFKVFLDFLEKFKLKDELSKFSILMRAYDTFKLLDGEPRTAESDFVLGIADDIDNAYDWFLPFGLKVDWNTTSIQVMPEAELTKIEMPGIDGSIVEDTVYKDRLFQIVAYSEDGLTRQQKEELKSKIAQILDSTKNKPKRLYVQAKDNAFDVKYEGQAVFTDGPSFVKTTIPLRTPPYGYKIYPDKLLGSGLILNDGDAPLGVQHNIIGPISNPSFRLNETIYTYNGSVPSGSTLVIDQDLMTCYLVDGVGRKENVLMNLTGDFQRIPKHSAVTLSASGTTAKNLTTTWRTKILW